jgi:polyisoprenoid-binding protein YceI
VRGQFREFDGTLEAAEEDPALIRVLDVDSYPEARYRVHPDRASRRRELPRLGDLTIKDVTREIEVNACVEAAAEDPWGNERVGVAVRGTINRTDFGLTWNQTLETGRMLVGEEVNVLIDISPSGLSARTAVQPSFAPLAL